VRLFVDRDLGKKLPRALRAVGVEVVAHIERYPSADEESIADAVWIAEATRRGEVIVTRDGRIRRMSAEVAAIKAAGARCFVLEVGNGTPFTYLRTLMLAWPALEKKVDELPPPFVIGINAKGRLIQRLP